MANVPKKGHAMDDDCQTTSGIPFEQIPHEWLAPTEPDFQKILSHPETLIIRSSIGALVYILVLVGVIGLLLAALLAGVLYVVSLIGVPMFQLYWLFVVLPLLLVGLVAIKLRRDFSRAPKLVFCERGVFNRTGIDEAFLPWLRITDIGVTIGFRGETTVETDELMLFLGSDLYRVNVAGLDRERNWIKAEILARVRDTEERLCEELGIPLPNQPPA